MSTFNIKVATDKEIVFSEEISEIISISAKQRGTGIAKRSPSYIESKIREGKAIIALSKNRFAGFCYIESWSDKKYTANSGLIVHPDFRGFGLASKIKSKAFQHSRKLFPGAKLFGLTTSLPVMKINSDLGYVPVTYNQLTEDQTFWDGCKSCVNYEILMSKNKDNCMCTAMLFDPARKKSKKWDFLKKSKLYSRFMKLKQKKLTQSV